MTKQEMLSLKVGDLVEDCAFNKSKIKSITDEYHLNKLGHLIVRILTLNYFLYPADIIDFLLKRKYFYEITDRILKLENGGSFSAINCCDIVKR